MSGSGKKSRGPLLSNHQKSWLWGTIPVWETLQAGRWPVYELVLGSNASQPIHHQCRELAEQAEIPVRTEDSTRLKQLCGAKDHQGVIALMGPFPYTPVNQLLNSTSSNEVVVLLDQVQDPFNVGAIVRSGAAFGIRGIILGTQSQAGVTSHVARSSVGMVNQVPICRVESLPETIGQLKKNGYEVIATTLQGKTSITQIRSETSSNHSPVVTLIGNEAKGVSQELVSLADKEVLIPMKSNTESLNAAVAAGIMLYELTRDQI